MQLPITAGSLNNNLSPVVDIISPVQNSAPKMTACGRFEWGKLAGPQCSRDLCQLTLSDVPLTLLYYSAVALTAITDNAALTYLGSIIDGTSTTFQYAEIAGAIGGGLTVIDKALNPPGFADLQDSFEDGTINALWLLIAATPPMLVAILAFQLLPKL